MCGLKRKNALFMTPDDTKCVHCRSAERDAVAFTPPVAKRSRPVEPTALNATSAPLKDSPQVANINQEVIQGMEAMNRAMESLGQWKESYISSMSLIQSLIADNLRLTAEVTALKRQRAETKVKLQQYIKSMCEDSGEDSEQKDSQ